MKLKWSHYFTYSFHSCSLTIVEKCSKKTTERETKEILSNKQNNGYLYRWSNIVIKKCSLNSKAVGNCSVNCQTQSMN